MKKDVCDEIQEQIRELKEDDRLKSDPASVQVNAPLALIQLELKTKIETLESVLEKLRKEMYSVMTKDSLSLTVEDLLSMGIGDETHVKLSLKNTSDKVVANVFCFTDPELAETIDNMVEKYLEKKDKE